MQLNYGRHVCRLSYLSNNSWKYNILGMVSVFIASMNFTSFIEFDKYQRTTVQSVKVIEQKCIFQHFLLFNNFVNTQLHTPRTM